MKKQRLLAAVLALSLFGAVPTSGYAAAAAPGGIVSPQYDMCKEPTSKLTISGKTADVTCSVIATAANFSGQSAILTLQRKNSSGSWSDVSGAVWSKTAKTKKITVMGTKDGLSSGTYRAKAVFTITTTDGESETITAYSEEQTVV